MQDHHNDEQYTTDLRIRRSHHRPQVPDNENRTRHEPQRHEHEIQRRDRRPTDQRHRNPYQIRIPIQRPTLQHIRALTPKPPQHTPERNRNNKRIPIDQATRRAQQREIIPKQFIPAPLRAQILGDGSREKKDEDDGGGDPEGPVEIRVAVEDVEEVGSRVEGDAAAAEHLGGVDVEELRVEG